MTDTYTRPEDDPTLIDWGSRQAAAVVPFDVIGGRPVNPYAPTGVRHGRGQLWHWGEQVCADAIVTAFDEDGHRWLVMVERGDGHGWAFPGGTVDPDDEGPLAAAIRELQEETCLALEGAWEALPARYVPDPRASDEAWMVTVPARLHLGTVRRSDLPVPVGADDAARAAWVRADGYADLVAYLKATYQGEVFAAHEAVLYDLLG
ncbi:NUDIX domain-containing protein [Nonomuraea sp. CA-143628]|uniref:NUDIX domain-containing protein n=1 Tax=Nonomuraea sp. CA-143628 TaxID=3239997 RepID=UPI003D8C9BA6